MNRYVILKLLLPVAALQMPALSTAACVVSQLRVSHQVVPRCGTAAQHTPGQDTGHTKSQYRHTLVTLLSRSAGYILGVGVMTA